MDKQCDRCRYKELGDPDGWCYMFKERSINCTQQEIACENWLGALRTAMEDLSTIAENMEKLAKAFDRVGNRAMYMEIDLVSLKLAEIRNDVWDATAAANKELG